MCRVLHLTGRPQHVCCAPAQGSGKQRARLDGSSAPPARLSSPASPHCRGLEGGTGQAPPGFPLLGTGDVWAGAVCRGDRWNRTCCVPGTAWLLRPPRLTQLRGTGGTRPPSAPTGAWVGEVSGPGLESAPMQQGCRAERAHAPAGWAVGVQHDTSSRRDVLPVPLEGNRCAQDLGDPAPPGGQGSVPLGPLHVTLPGSASAVSPPQEQHLGFPRWTPGLAPAPGS